MTQFQLTQRTAPGFGSLARDEATVTSRMSHHRQVRNRYEWLGWQIVALLFAGIVSVWLAGLALHGTGPGNAAGQIAATELLRSEATRPIAHRLIRFVPAAQDYTAYEAASGSVISRLGFERDGFIVSTIKSLDRARRAAGLDLTKPYRLSQWNNGQLLFEDPMTGAQMDLSAFGSTNAKAFARLLNPKN